MLEMEFIIKLPRRVAIRKFEYLVFVCGAILGIWFVTPHNFLPWNVDWLTSGDDGSSFQISWEFFRQSPMFQWPITSTPKYVEGANTVLASANGVFGIPAKALGLIFREQFQFYGVWIAMTFALQALLAFRLIGLFVADHYSQIIGASLFVLAPAFVFRIGHMSHFELGSHWLILAGLYLCFSNKRFILNWSVLLLLSIMISVYIAAMITILFLASFVNETFINKKISTNQKKVGAFVAPFTSLLIGFVFMGYLSYSGSSTGTGFFRLNVLAYFNPGYSWTESFSRIFEVLVSGDYREKFVEEQEMFQYLGIGSIATLIGLGIYVLKHGCIDWWRNKIVVLCALLVMLLTAYSNRLGLFGHEFVYWWPERFQSIRQIFRAATRFGWPMYYMIILGGFVATSRLIPKKFRFAVLLCICTINLLDVLPGVKNMHYDIMVKTSGINANSKVEWKSVLDGKEILSVYPNFDLQIGETIPDARVFEENWYLLARLAVENHMSTNFGYVSRPITEYIAAQDSKNRSRLQSGKLDPSVVYIIGNKSEWEMFTQIAGPSVISKEIDGFWVITSR